MITDLSKGRTILLIVGLIVGVGTTFVIHTFSSSALVGLVVTIVFPFFIAAMLGVAKTTTP